MSGLKTSRQSSKPVPVNLFRAPLFRFRMKNLENFKLGLAFQKTLEISNNFKTLAAPWLTDTDLYTF